MMITVLKVPIKFYLGRTHMKRYTLGVYEKALPGTLSWKEKMEAAREAGYDFIEISVDETDAKLARLDWTAQERRDLSALMAETGIPVRSMCLSGHRKFPLGHPDASMRERSMEIMSKAIDLSDELGIRIIQLAGYDVYYEEGSEETRKFFLENLIRSAEMAARKGILMGFETMETPFMNTTEKAMFYVNTVQSPYLGVYPDLGNITNAAVLDLSGEPDPAIPPAPDAVRARVDADLETGRGHVQAMHLKETVPNVFREVPFGTGHVQFEAGIRKAWEIGVRRFVTELWFTGNPAWKEDLKTAVNMMRPILDTQS